MAYTPETLHLFEKESLATEESLPQDARGVGHLQDVLDTGRPQNGQDSNDPFETIEGNQLKPTPNATRSQNASGTDATQASNEGDDDEDESPDDAPLDSMHLWQGDAGTLPYDARAALLRLVKGPYISETADGQLWRALLNYADAIRSRLADLFLDLCIDAEAGVAFAKNVSADEGDFPKAATSYAMTMLDTIMVLILRKELLTSGSTRVFVGQTDLFAQMGQYRTIDKIDQAAFLKKLEASWGRLVKQRILIRSDIEGRFEISPVLKLVFGSEEAEAVLLEYQQMKQADERQEEQPSTKHKEVTLFDGLE